jgi:hypothetical protein
MARLFLFTCLICLFFSCRKKGEVRGRVINFHDGTPIAGITFDIFEAHGNGIGWTGVYKSNKLDEVTTDAGGFFNVDLQFKKRDSYDYTLIMRTDPDKVIDTSAPFETYYYLFEPNNPNHVLSKNKTEIIRTMIFQKIRLKTWNSKCVRVRGSNSCRLICPLMTTGILQLSLVIVPGLECWRRFLVRAKPPFNIGGFRPMEKCLYILMK